MANDKPTPKPTREETAVNLLRLGQLLHQFSCPIGDLGLTRPIKPEEAERLREKIVALERRIEAAVNDLRQWVLRSVFSMKGQGVVDGLTVRIVAYVAWANLASERPDVSVARVANCVSMGDLALHLEVRRTTRLLIARDVAIRIKDSDFSGGQLLPGERLIRFLSGEGNLGVLFNAQSIQEEKAEWERKRNSEVQGKASPSIPAETNLPEGSEPKAPLFYSQPPKAIYEALRKNVVGMDQVVKKFSVQMAMHLKRVAIARSGGTLTSPPVVVLLIGPSGAGKTFLAEEAGKLLKVPFCSADMTSVSASSYVGTSVDELFLGFAKKGVALADVETGLMLFDEMDKKRTNQRGGDFDSMGLGVQYEVLKMLEGTRVQIGGKRGNDSVQKGFLETRTMAFVLAGSFSDVEAKLRESARTRTPLGFSGKDDASRIPPDTRELLLEYFIPELVNRIGSVIVIPPPSLGQLVQIATAPTGIIFRLNQFFETSFSLKVVPSPEAIQAIASWALESRTFARGMRSLIMQTLVEEAIFEERKGDVAIGVEDVRKAVEGLKTETAGLA